MMSSVIFSDKSQKLYESYALLFRSTTQEQRPRAYLVHFHSVAGFVLASTTFICFYIVLDTEQIPYINHLTEKLMHMTVDSAMKRSVGIDDNILVGDDKSHLDR